jgi:hypothetical protein
MSILINMLFIHWRWYEELVIFDDMADAAMLAYVQNGKIQITASRARIPRRFSWLVLEFG